jgi:23S rRNA (cytosine1962-C5)-methyltransferase
MAKPSSPQNPYAPKSKASAPSEPNHTKNPGKPKSLPARDGAQHRVAPTPAPARPARVEPPAAAFGARISRRASDRLRNGHLWVYATDIESIKASEADTLLPVADNRGILMGTALYSPASQIALRMVSRQAIDQAQWLEQLAARLRTAIARRKPLLNENTNACRLVFSEADDLPGLIIDKYAGIVIVQLLAKGLDSAEVREACTRVLREELEASETSLTIWERPDPRIRELEGLSAPATTPLYSSNATAPVSSTIFLLNGLSFHFDVNSGQKTGAFLDQRENYAAAAAWAKARGTKKALDVCTYQGGFALHLAQVCEQVTGVDASRASLQVAEHNLDANRANLKAEVDWVEADAFELLRGWSESKDAGTWDLIVLDPPAFAKSKRAVEGALRGYKELNLRALRMIRAGGLLITCSCSHHVTWSDLESAVASAAVDAHRRVTLLDRRGAAQDHPVLLNLPETEYLKCLICQVD